MSLTKMQKIVLGYPKLKQRIETRESPAKERDKTLKNLEEIKADFSPRASNGLLKVMDKTLPKLYDDINFDNSQVDVKNLLKDKSVVFVPNHQSHADYLAINYVFYKTYKIHLKLSLG